MLQAFPYMVDNATLIILLILSIFSNVHMPLQPLMNPFSIGIDLFHVVCLSLVTIH